MLPYGIGLDVGIASVGWAIVALDDNENPCGIINMGSRIYDTAEQPKTGESLAKPRRDKRSLRRRVRRHRHRNERIRYALVQAGLLTQDELNHLFDGKLSDIYALRVRALDEAVTATEFARILIHISQRRGFKSNRKGAAAAEDGELLKAISANKERMLAGGYRTVAELMLKDDAFSYAKRNKGGAYINTVTRDMVADEVAALFRAQRRFGSAFATEKLEEDYLTILLSQRSFDDGPGGNSPYGGSQIEKMVGKCTFFPEESRAAKATYSFEYFRLLQEVNHMRLLCGGETLELSEAQRKALVSLAHKTDAITFARIRTELGIPDEITFKSVTYKSDKTPDACEKETKLKVMASYHKMRKALDKISKDYILGLTSDQRDAIGTALTLYKTDEKIRPVLSSAGLADVVIDALAELNFSGFGHISIKACRQLIPHLETGMRYNMACQEAGFDFRGHENTEKSMYLRITAEDYEEITSPVVKRAISQTVKVVNAIIRSQGCSPSFLNIELAREMAKDFKERQSIKKENNDNQAQNERLMNELRETYGLSKPSGYDLVKLRLYKEQASICPYSQKVISAERLFEPDYAEVDHIIPYSISFDDSRKNKVLVLASENRNKGNRLPLEYLTGKRREDFIVWVNSNVKDFRKRRQLLKEKITEEDRNQFIERNLQDTKTASVFLQNFIRDHLEFAASKRRTKRVYAVNGAMTAYIRKRWGVKKIREDGDLHHAVDAVVIACTTDSMIQQISRYAKWRECQYIQTDAGSTAIDPTTGEVLKDFPYPWYRFRKELEAWMEENPAATLKDLKLPLYVNGLLEYPKAPFVSRMPHHKVTGAAHLDTFKGARESEAGLAIVKRPLTVLKLKNGEIQDYYNPDSDRLLYEALKARLLRYGGDAQKAFAEPFYKPKHDGTPGNRVNKVKLVEKTTLNVPVLDRTAIADNGDMVRIDVFYVESDGYYFVPIYVHDTVKDTLPVKACVAYKSYDDWKDMDESNFIFSLFRNDLISVDFNKPKEMALCKPSSTLLSKISVSKVFAYFDGANISSGAISIINHDETYKIGSLGFKTLKSVEKCTVDVLGNIHVVKREKRQGFSKKGE